MIDTREAEAAVLGSVLAAPELWPKVSAFLDADDFALQENRIVFLKMREVSIGGVPTDAVTVASAINGDLDKFGGAAYVLELTRLIPSALHVDYYAAILKKARHERAIVEVCRALAEDPGDEEPRTKLRAALNAAETTSSRAMSLQEMATDYLGVLDNRALGNLDTIKTGLTNLDRIVGFTRKALVTFGARTSKGKSAFLLKLSYLFAKNGLKVLFVSAEMTRTELMDRLMAIKTSVPLWTIRKQNVKDEMGKMTAAVSELSGLPLHIEEGGKFTMARIMAAVETVRPDVLAVDYIQRFTPPGKTDTRAAFFSDIANGLKSLAMEKNILVLTASQLNRELEHRTNGIPSLADLKESGGIEEASDVVILIHSPKVGEDRVRNVVLLISKNRNGACGSIPYFFYEDTANFEESDNSLF